MKALSNLSILKLFAAMGSGFDIVSVGELMRCLRAGADPRKIVFSGVGKTDEEIEAALEARHPDDQRRVAPANCIAWRASRRRMRRRAPVSLRVNPDLDPGTHPHISTGHRDSKFGIPLVAGGRILRRGARAAESRSGRAEHAYRIADNRHRAVHRGRQQGRDDRRALRERGHRAQVPRPRRRSRYPIPGRAAAALGIRGRAARAAARTRTEDHHRAGPRAGRQRRRAGDARALRQGDRRQALHRGRRRDERSDPAGALRGLSRDTAGRTARRRPRS